MPTDRAGHTCIAGSGSLALVATSMTPPTTESVSVVVFRGRRPATPGPVLADAENWAFMMPSKTLSARRLWCRLGADAGRRATRIVGKMASISPSAREGSSAIGYRGRNYAYRCSVTTPTRGQSAAASAVVVSGNAAQIARASNSAPPHRSGYQRHRRGRRGRHRNILYQQAAATLHQVPGAPLARHRRGRRDEILPIARGSHRSVPRYCATTAPRS